MARRLNDAGEEGLVNPRTQSRPHRHRLLTDAAFDELDAWQLDRCLALQTDAALVAAIQSTTHSAWWPPNHSPMT